MLPKQLFHCTQQGCHMIVMGHSIVCATSCWGQHRRKHQRPPYLALCECEGNLLYWPFVRGICVQEIHRSPVNSPCKGQWHEALMFSLICAWMNSWVNNGEAGDFRCHHAHYVVTVMPYPNLTFTGEISDSEGEICELKLWSMFFFSHCSAVCSIMFYIFLYWTLS